MPPSSRSSRSSSPPHFNKAATKNHIPIAGPPLHARARRLPPDKLHIAREEFQQMDMEIVRHSDGPWASPLYMVPK